MDKKPVARKERSSVIMSASAFITLILGAGLLAVLLLVVPRFKEGFAQFGTPVPAITACVFGVSDFLCEHGIVSALAACIALTVLAIPVVLLKNGRKALLWSYIVAAWILIVIGVVAVTFGMYLSYFRLINQMGEPSGF